MPSSSGGCADSRTSSDLVTDPPAETPCVRTLHRVAFFETDAMRIVHHANYLRWFELARVEWMDEYHVPYRRYVEEGLHFATTHIEIDFKSPARFDDRVTINAWLAGLGGASLAMDYCVECEGRTLVRGRSEHACVDDAGRVRRIPADRRANLQTALAPQPD